MIRTDGFLAGLLLAVAITLPATAQERVLGLDVSYWNTGNDQSAGSEGISQANWNTAFSTGNRKFVWARATRGGTTGQGQTSGTPGGGSAETLLRRYDDPRFIQNITRATTAGMYAGAYHYGRPDLAANTGANEADHFIQMAGAFMRAGYLMPVFDLESGQVETTPTQLAQFTLDFSNRIYEVMQIRPAIYINGNYSSEMQNATQAQRNQLAQPVGSSPTVTGPAYPMLWNARYPDNDNPNSIPIQTGSPKTPSPEYPTVNSYYGPWDDYGNADPWSFWQYASTLSIPGINAVDSGVDGNVAHGDIEYVRNYLIPAIWWNDASGDWSTLNNWNSGQATIVPIQAPGQATPFATGPLPPPRLPGAAGTGPNSGQYDTVILERPNANITVTLATGVHNVRKLYMREALEITGGTLTINYDPTYRANNSANVLHGGPLSAQFSGAVSLIGSGNLNVHTLQVDAQRTFTVGSTGTLSFNRINLMPHASAAAKMLLSGDLNVTPLGGAAATISAGAGAGVAGVVDLGGAARAINVADGAAAVDLTIGVPVTNGGLIKQGAGTLALTGLSTYAGDTSVEAGVLSLTSARLADAADLFLTTGATLNLNFAGTDVIDSLFVDGLSLAAGVWGAVGSGAAFTSPLLSGAGLLEVSTFAPPTPGDFNGDGFVDSADLSVWSGNFGATDAGVAQGDADGDGLVDGSDFLIWQRNATFAGGASAVPEPTALALVSAALATLIAVRRRRMA
jgi:autotransporter-associated beta strand protein